MNIEKITSKHKDLIKKMLKKKFEDYKLTFIDVPVGRVNIESFVKSIIENDGYIANDGETYGFISMTYKGNLFYNRQGLYHAEWAHYLPDNDRLKIALLEACYDYMKIYDLKDHTLSFLANRKDLDKFFFDASYGSRCVDAHTMIDSSFANADSHIRVASYKDLEKLVPLVDEHHMYMNDVVQLGMNFEDSSELLKEWLLDDKVSILIYEDVEIKGMMMLVHKASGGCRTASDEETLGIETTQVSKIYQGEGIGLKLLKQAHKYGSEKGFKYLAVDFESFNFAAHNFWSKYFTLTMKSVIRNIG